MFYGICSIKQSSNISELWSQSVIVGSKCFQQRRIVLTVDYLAVQSCFLSAVIVLTACPCEQISSALELWSPAGLEKWIVLSLESSLHFHFFFNSWHVVIICAVLQKWTPHLSLVFIIALNLESLVNWRYFLFQSKFFNECFTPILLFFSNLPLDFCCKLSFEENVWCLLLQLGFMLLLIKHFYLKLTKINKFIIYNLIF